MPKILIAECTQEISSFNPLSSGYEDFRIRRGADLLANAGLNTAIGGALSEFSRDRSIEVVPTISAGAPSAGILSAAGWQRLMRDVLSTIEPHLSSVDAVYFSLHGAMGAVGDLDPEGYLLQETRRLLGPDKPMVISLDLHGILTDRMLRQIDGLRHLLYLSTRGLRRHGRTRGDDADAYPATTNSGR